MLKKSHQLDIASSYVTHSKNILWQEILHLAEKKEIKVRLIAGLDGAVTSPEVLRTNLPRVRVKRYLKKERVFFIRNSIFLTQLREEKKCFWEVQTLHKKVSRKMKKGFCIIQTGRWYANVYFNEIWSSRNAVKFSPDRLRKYEELPEFDSSTPLIF